MATETYDRTDTFDRMEVVVQRRDGRTVHFVARSPAARRFGNPRKRSWAIAADADSGFRRRYVQGTLDAEQELLRLASIARGAPVAATEIVRTEGTRAQPPSSRRRLALAGITTTLVAILVLIAYLRF